MGKADRSYISYLMIFVAVGAVLSESLLNGVSPGRFSEHGIMYGKN